MQDRFKFRIPFYDWDDNFIGFSELDIEQGAEPYNYGRCYHKDIEQCTGLKDKNGKLIYEGDIVYYYERAIVKYGEFNCSCCDGVYGWYFDNGDIRYVEYYEVIGNIHENADLLENKDE